MEFLSFSDLFSFIPRLFIVKQRLPSAPRLLTLFRARVDAPVQTRARTSRTHRSFVFLPSPFTFTAIPLKICNLHVNKTVILTLHR